MRDHETKKDGAHGHPPPKAKTGGERDAARRQADGQAAARPDLLRDERLAHPANAEPLAELLSQLQQSHGNAYVQRFASESGADKSSEAKAAAGSKAKPLDPAVRSRMESAFGESFGDVRVHAGKGAGDAAGELDARALTRGRDIYFREGEYNPSTREGQELLAHELTHVVQQRGGPSARGASVGAAGDTFEREADEVAASVVRGERAHVEKMSAAPDVQRQQKGPQPQLITALSTLMLEPNKLKHDSRFSGDYGTFGVGLYLQSVEGANFDTLHVTLPAGVSVSVVDLSGMGVQVQDPGGTGARAVIVRVNRKVGIRMLQLTFSKGNYVFIATYQLPAVSPAAALSAAVGSGEAGKKK